MEVCCSEKPNKRQILLFHIAITFLSCAVLGPLFFWMHPYSINQDTYWVISIANYYLFEGPTQAYPNPIQRHTLPLFLVIVKLLLTGFISWQSDYDVLLVKTMAVFCYTIIFNMAGTYFRETVSLKITLAFISLMILSMPVEMDTASLNGELVSVMLLCLLLLVFRIKEKIVWIVSVSTISILIVYTKEQSIVILTFLLLWGRWKYRGCDWYCLFWVLIIIVGFDLLLFIFNLGLISTLAGLFKYLSFNPDLESANAPGLLGLLLGSRYIQNLGWALKTMTYTVPLMPIVLVWLLLFVRKNRSGGMLESPILWFAILLFTSLSPGFQFSHYTLYAVFYTVFIGRQVLEHIDSIGVEAKARKGVVIFLIVFMLVKISVLVSYDGTTVKIKTLPKFDLDDRMLKFVDIVESDPGKLIIHGWNYRFYSVFGKGSYGVELPAVYFEMISEEEYLEVIQDEDFSYIIDVIAHSGLIRDKSYQISLETIYGQHLLKTYGLIADIEGARLYKKGLISCLQPGISTANIAMNCEK